MNLMHRIVAATALALLAASPALAATKNKQNCYSAPGPECRPEPQPVTQAQNRPWETPPPVQPPKPATPQTR